MAIEGEQVLAVIPARGGSKGLPRKNIADLGGRPLIVWSIEQAGSSQYIDRAIVSSEDEEILDVARQHGGDVPFRRPDNLAMDDSSVYDVMLHAVDTVEGDWTYLVLLQPTSPLRIAADIDACIELCYSTSGKTPAVSVTETGKSPYWAYCLDESDSRISPLLPQGNAIDRRQNLPKSYHLNGAVYVARVDWLRQQRTFISPDTRGYIMPPERSVDVDSEFDLKLIRTIVNDDVR